MTLQRLTLLPTADKATRDSATSLPVRSGQQTDVTSITRLSQGGRWRTEAMRSYDRPVLIWFTRGQGRVTIAGRSGGYGAHSAIFLPAGTMHGFSVTPAVLGSLVRLTAEDAALWPSEPCHLRLREVYLQRELTGMIDALERESAADLDMSARAIRHHAGLLAIWFERTYQSIKDAETAKPAETAAHRLTEAFTALVERDYAMPVGVKHFAAKLGVTPTHLSRACRESSGRAALDILVDRRHFEACRLLADTKMPVADVANSTGHASAAYFTRAFRARSGRSPSEFRREK